MTGYKNKKPSALWLSVGGVAEMLDMHPNTVKRMPPSILPYWLSNRRGDRKYARSDVEAYIAKRYVR